MAMIMQKVFMCVRKTRILSIILSVCICMCTFELKRKDRPVLTGVPHD